MEVETNDWVCSLLTGKPYNGKYMWLNIAMFSLTHTGAVVGAYLLLVHASWYTWLWCVFLYSAGVIGTTAGAHRLWTHKGYKANVPYRVLIMLMNCVAYQNDVIRWALWHRCHHKWSDTDGDPHNAGRGLFYSHIGWLLVRPHEEFVKKRQTLDMSDLEMESVLVFQRKYFAILAPLCCFVLPTAIPYLFWQESLLTGFLGAGLCRWMVSLHVTWCVNSLAHTHGLRPYDGAILPSEHFFTTFFAMGEGFHNYHHTYPQDYRASEYSFWFNPSTVFIDFFAWLGWCYDLKVISPEKIEQKKITNLHKMSNNNKIDNDTQNGQALGAGGEKDFPDW